MTPQRLLVTGGTGTLGQLVVPRLRAHGLDMRVLSRSARQPATDGVQFVTGDLQSGQGIDAAVDGVDTILHCAGTSKRDGEKARHLVEAAARSEVRHLVFISVVGADRVPVNSAVDRAMFGYFGSKREAEEAIEVSGVPFTTLRASQFHELVLDTVRQLTRLPVALVPGGRFQPIAAAEVADRLVELALGEPAGLVPEMAGPQVRELRDLVRTYLDASGKHRLTLPFRPPGAGGRAVRDGAITAPDHAVVHQTWEQFVATRA